MERREILEKLAAKEIDRAEAERLLSESGEPMPEPQELPAPPKSSKRGVLILLFALIGGGMLLLVVPLIAFLYFVGANRTIEKNMAIKEHSELRAVHQQHAEQQIIEQLLQAAKESGETQVYDSDGLHIEVSPDGSTLVSREEY